MSVYGQPAVCKLCVHTYHIKICWFVHLHQFRLVILLLLPVMEDKHSLMSSFDSVDHVFSPVHLHVHLIHAHYYSHSLYHSNLRLPLPT